MLGHKHDLLKLVITDVNVSVEVMKHFATQLVQELFGYRLVVASPFFFPSSYFLTP